MATSSTSAYVPLQAQWMIGVFTADESQFPTSEFYHPNPFRPLPGVDEKLWARLVGTIRVIQQEWSKWKLRVVIIHFIGLFLGYALLAAAEEVHSQVLTKLIAVLTLVFFFTGLFLWVPALKIVYAERLHRQMQVRVQEELAPSFLDHDYKLTYVSTAGCWVQQGHVVLERVCSDQGSAVQQHDRPEVRAEEWRRVELDTSVCIHLAGHKCHRMRVCNGQQSIVQDTTRARNEIRPDLSGQHPQHEQQMDVLVTGVLLPHFRSVRATVNRRRLYLAASVCWLAGIVQVWLILFVFDTGDDDSLSPRQWATIVTVWVPAAMIWNAADRWIHVQSRELYREAATSLEMFGRYRFVFLSQKTHLCFLETYYLEIVEDGNEHHVAMTEDIA